MKVRSSIVQKQSQALVLTQTMQAALKILQCSQLELEQEISSILDENMMIEQDVSERGEVDDFLYDNDADSIKNDQDQYDTTDSERSIDLDIDTPLEVVEDWASFEDTGGNSDQNSSQYEHNEFDEFDKNIHESSLEEYLISQLYLLKLSQKDFLIGTFIINELDENGYFLQSSMDIVQALLGQYPDLEVDEDEVTMMLHHIQQFDPPGIASNSLEESLIKQIMQLEPVPYWKDEAIDLLRYRSKWLLQHDLKKIEKHYHFLEEEVIEMLAAFKQLNPYPAVNFSSQKVEAVKPDVIVSQRGDIVTVSLNEDVLPKLRINRKYARLAQQSKIENRELLRNHLNEARFFLKSIEDRFDTLLKVATAVVSFQQAFFIHGDKSMKVLRLQDIAETLQINESTVSRAVSGKYLMCARGIFPLNFFFTNKIIGSEDDASSVAIRAVLLEIIESEQKTKPYSDQKLQTLLEERGHSVSRRTVSKYREILGVPSSAQRKQLV